MSSEEKNIQIEDRNLEFAKIDNLRGIFLKTLDPKVRFWTFSFFKIGQLRGKKFFLDFFNFLECLRSFKYCFRTLKDKLVLHLPDYVKIKK